MTTLKEVMDLLIDENEPDDTVRQVKIKECIWLYKTLIDHETKRKTEKPNVQIYSQ